MAEDYPVDTDLGYVRFLISDVTAGDGQVFTDAEIEAVMDRNPSVEMAAAVLLERVADNELLIAKVIRSQDLQTDGAKVADSLRKSAQRLRDDHAEKVAGDADDVSIIEYGPFLGVWPELVERPY